MNDKAKIEEMEFDILPFLKKGDSYDVAQVLCNRFGRYFRPARNYPNPSPGTHVESIACGNLLYEIVISSRIDMGNIMAYERFKEKRHANAALKDGVCACPLDQMSLLHSKVEDD